MKMLEASDCASTGQKSFLPKAIVDILCGNLYSIYEKNVFAQCLDLQRFIRQRRAFACWTTAGLSKIVIS